MTNMRPLRITSPADLLAAVPCVLGFHPQDSLVLLTTDAAARQLHARIDLPQDREEVRAVTAQLMTAVRRSGAAGVALVAYTDDQCLALETVCALDAALAAEGVGVLVAVRADGERWYSLSGCEDACCLVDGTPYDVSTHPVTAQAVLDGRVTYRSRQELADSLVGTDCAAVEAVSEAADEAMQRFRSASRHALGAPEPERARRYLVTEGRWVHDRLARYLTTGEPLDAGEAGRLLVAMVHLEVRDVAWAAITRDSAAVHVELWRDLVRRTPLDLAAAPAALLAFAAWQAGDGALAWCALDRCQEAEPGYSLAGLLTQALSSAVDPATWQHIPVDDLNLFAS